MASLCSFFFEKLCKGNKKQPETFHIRHRLSRRLFEISAWIVGSGAHFTIGSLGSNPKLKLQYCWWFRNPVNSPVEGTVVYQVRLVVYPIIYRFFLHPRWLFGISEPSTVSLHKKSEKNLDLLHLCFQIFHGGGFLAKTQQVLSRMDGFQPRYNINLPVGWLHFRLRLKCQKISNIPGTPCSQPYINGCFNWMIPNLYIGNGWKSPNIYL